MSETIIMPQPEAYCGAGCNYKEGHEGPHSHEDARRMSGELARMVAPVQQQAPQITLLSITQEQAELLQFYAQATATVVDCEAMLAPKDLDPDVRAYWLDELSTAQAEQAAALAAIVDVEVKRVQKVDRTHALLKWLDFASKASTAEAQSLRRRAEVLVNIREAVSAAVVQALYALNTRKVESDTRRLRLHPSTPSVEVTDATAVPDKFMRAVVTIGMEDWKALLDWARESPGLKDGAVDEIMQRSKVEAEPMLTLISKELKRVEPEQKKLTARAEELDGEGKGKSAQALLDAAAKLGVTGCKLLRPDHVRCE